MTLIQKITRGASYGLALAALAGLALSGAKADTITAWNMDVTTVSPPAPSTGTGTASRSSGLSAASPEFVAGNPSTGFAWSSINFTALDTEATAVANNDYLEFVVSTSGYAGISFSFDARSSGTGPNRASVYYSTDGSSFTASGVVKTVSTSGFTGSPHVTSLASVTALDNNANARFRIYGWGGTAIGGTCRIDNVIISGTPAGVSTPPTGTGTANPASVDLGSPTTLSVTVTPGTNPDSTGITVTGDLSSIGGSSSQAFSNGGSGNVYTYVATPSGTAGTKSIPVTIADAESRSSITNIALEVTQLLTVAQARAKGMGNVTVRGLVSAIHVGNVYITDADGGAGLMVYKSGWATAGSPWTDVQVGDDITVFGPLSTYFNELELNDATSLVINSTGNTLPEPVEITLPANQTDEGRLVTLKDLKISTAPTAMGTYSSFTVADTTANGMTIFIHKNTTSGATAWPGVPANPIDLSTFKVGEFITVTGVLGDYTSGLQIKPRNGDDIEWLGKPLPVSDLADGAVKSSPVAFNGKVFCGNNAGIVRCINTSTGVNTWEYNVVDEGAGNVLGRPALKSVGGTNYVFFTTEDGFVFCLNAADGAFVWSVGPLMTGATGVDTTPAVVSSATAASLADVSVYVTMFKGDEGRVYRLAGVDGALAATSDDLITAASGGKLSSPSVNDAGVFVSVTGGDAAGYRLIPGEATLTVSTQVALGKNSEQPPYIYNYWDAAYPRVLIAANDGTLSAFNATNGEIAYQNADVSSGAALTFPVARRDGNVVYMAGSNGIVYQANVADGTAPAGGYSFYTGAAGTTIQGLAIDPAGIGGAATLVFGDSSGAYHKVPLADASGAKVVKAVQTAGSVFATTPTIDATGGMVLLGNDNATVYGFARD